MRRRLPLLALCSFLFIPVAFAAQEDVWNLADGSVDTHQSSLTSVNRAPDGLHIQTDTDGFLFWLSPLNHPVDVMMLHIINNGKPIAGGLVWHPPDTPPGASTQVDFQVNAGNGVQDVPIVPTSNPYWTWNVDQIGLGFPAGSNVILQSITWTHYSLIEKIVNEWNSFWTFDSLRPYTINFLWGPIIVTDPYTRATMFNQLPPPGWSASRIFYALIIIAVVCGIVLLFTARNRIVGKRRMWTVIAATIAVVWIIFDLRMGSEMLTYAFTDISTYVTKTGLTQTLRTHSNMYAIARQVLPTVMNYKKYVVLQGKDEPMYDIMRYMSYPSIALPPSANDSDIKLWFVFDRPDITLQNGQLTDASGNALTPPGSIIQQVNGSAYLFATP